MSGGMWRPAGHCGANVSTCQGNCICGAEVRAELKEAGERTEGDQ